MDLIAAQANNNIRMVRTTFAGFENIFEKGRRALIRAGALSELDRLRFNQTKKREINDFRVKWEGAGCESPRTDCKE